MSELENQSIPDASSTPREPLPTLWEVPEALWEKLFLPLLDELDPPSHMGRPRVNPRPCLNGMIYRARTGCQWNHLPTEFGSDSTVHRTVYRWDKKGVFDHLWALLIYHCEDLQAVHWEWQAADGCLSKARFIGKKGAKANRAKHRKTRQQTSPKQTSPKQTSPKQTSPKQTSPKQTSPKQTSPKAKISAKASAPTPPTVASWASSKACLLKKEAALLLCASQAQT
jgi:transposase